MNDYDKRGAKKTGRTPKKTSSKQSKSKKKVDKEIPSLNDYTEHCFFDDIEEEDATEFDQRNHLFDFLVDQIMYRNHHNMIHAKGDQNEETNEKMSLEGTFPPFNAFSLY